jgi:hypothetical protein
MGSVLHMQAEVLPGNKIELDAPTLRVGEIVEVTVRPTGDSEVKRRSSLDVIMDFMDRHPDWKPIDADAYIRAERNAWDR